MRTCYQNAILADASGVRRGELVVEDGRFGAAGPCENYVDMAGLTLLPALVDMHCHLRDPGYPQKETLQSGMRAAVAGGFGTLCAMANTEPVTETAQQVEANLVRARQLGLCRLVQSAAAGVGLGDETPTDYAALSRVTRVITNDGKTILSDAFMRNLLIASREYGFLISTHCQPERATVARDLRLLKEVGGNLHIGHISHRETLEQIREAKAAGLRFTCEVTPHHLFGYDCDYRVNPPLRSKADVLAMIEGVRDGSIDCLATDHAPHTPADKARGMAGISNFDYALQIFLTVFYENGIALSRLSQMGAQTPARLLGLGAGSLAVGEVADLIAVDTAAQGRIAADAMRSRSHNTPFDGAAVRGRVMMTMIGGNVLYDHGQIV